MMEVSEIIEKCNGLGLCNEEIFRQLVSLDNNNSVKDNLFTILLQTQDHEIEVFKQKLKALKCD